MKKMFRVMMVVACLFLAVPTYAQLHLGVKGGLNVSKISFSESGRKGENKIGWFIGPMAEFTLPIIGIGIDAAALYSQTDLAAKGLDTDATLKTFEIPVNLKWSFGLGRMLGIYVAAGPQFGFNIGNKKSFMRYDLKKNNTTFNVGAGVKLIRHLQLGVNYNFALNSTGTVTVPMNAGDEEVIKIKNNTWQVSLAYLF